MNANDIATLTYIESMTTETILTCGGMLSCAREAAGLSQQEVAQHLNLLPTIVRAIEADDFSAIRSPVFCRGYLTSYAKLMNLPVADVLAAYQQLVGTPAAEVVKPVIKPVVNSVAFKPVAIDSNRMLRKGYAKAMLAIAATIVVAVTLFVANTTSTKSLIDTPVVLTASPSTVVTTVAPSIPAVQNSSNAPISTAASTSTIAPVEVASNSTTSTAIALPGVNALKIADQSGKEVSTAAAPLSVETSVASENAALKAGENQLSLRFTDKCWVEIRDSNNVVIASGIYRANEKLNLTGKGPFKLSLGFAPGVNVALNGQAIEVGQGDSVNHTAFLVVGSS
jgi:cytoskeleton protein RodZ